jgi:hypothetical protein
MTSDDERQDLVDLADGLRDEIESELDECAEWTPIKGTQPEAEWTPLKGATAAAPVCGCADEPYPHFHGAAPPRPVCGARYAFATDPLGVASYCDLEPGHPDDGHSDKAGRWWKVTPAGVEIAIEPTAVAEALADNAAILEAPAFTGSVEELEAHLQQLDAEDVRAAAQAAAQARPACGCGEPIGHAGGCLDVEPGEEPPPDDVVELDVEVIVDLQRLIDDQASKHAAELAANEARFEQVLAETAGVVEKVRAERDSALDQVTVLEADLYQLHRDHRDLQAALAAEKAGRAAEVYELREAARAADEKALIAESNAEKRAKEAESAAAALVREARAAADQASTNADADAKRFIEAERAAIARAKMWEVIVGKQRVYVAAADIDRAIAAARAAHPNQPIGGCHEQNIKVLVG